MKNLFLLLAIITLSFQSCSSSDDGDKNEETVVSPYAGTWNGTYAGDDTGTFSFVISSEGIFQRGSALSSITQLTATIVSLRFANTDEVIVGYDNGTRADGTVNGTSMFGTWNNSTQNISGTWSANIE